MKWLWDWLSIGRGDWLTNLLSYLGLSNKRGKLLFLGLDNAGKTTLTGVLKHGKITQNSPTQRPGTEEMSLGGITFLVYDLGGHEQVRRVWKDYFPAVDAIVFLIDSADLKRINEAKAELDELLKDEQVEHCPILVLGNKIDKRHALSEDQLKWFLGIQNICTGKETMSRSELMMRPLELFMCSVWRQEGYGSGLRWLSHYLESS